MTTNPEIGNAAISSAAEAEPPATSFVPVGGSTEAEWIRQNAIRFMKHDPLCGVIGGYNDCTCGMEAARQSLLDAGIATSAPADSNMGVTGNAILLLGFIAGVIDARSADSWYELVDLDSAAGTQDLRNTVTGNTFRVSVIQLEGTV